MSEDGRRRASWSYTRPPMRSGMAATKAIPAEGTTSRTLTYIVVECITTRYQSTKQGEIREMRSFIPPYS